MCLADHLLQAALRQRQRRVGASEEEVGQVVDPPACIVYQAAFPLHKPAVHGGHILRGGGVVVGVRWRQLVLYEVDFVHSGSVSCGTRDNTTPHKSQPAHLLCGVCEGVVPLAAHILQQVELRRKVGEEVWVQGAGWGPREGLLRRPHDADLHTACCLGCLQVSDH
jgi:hypothetical protein